jgi:hypothetical protein
MLGYLNKPKSIFKREKTARRVQTRFIWELLKEVKRARKQTTPLARQNYAPRIPLPALLAAGFFAATFFLAAGFLAAAFLAAGFFAATFFLAAGFLAAAFLAAGFFAAGFFVVDVAILILHKI